MDVTRQRLYDLNQRGLHPQEVREAEGLGKQKIVFLETESAGLKKMGNPQSYKTR